VTSTTLFRSLPGPPVPVTGQTSAGLLAGAALR
jgi:hypothetical protein